MVPGSVSGGYSRFDLAGKTEGMVDFLKFDELEKKINGLIEDYALLKKRNLEVEGLLQNKTMELEEANKKLGGLKEERDVVRTKVDSLLDLIQEIKVP
ncbi:MAG: cell division protein ZapB [Minisyncoccota bacterium]